MMFRKIQQHVGSYFLSLLVLGVLLGAPLQYNTDTHSISVREAEALFGVGDIVFDPAAFAEMIVQSTIFDKEWRKEYLYDKLMWEIINRMIDEMTENTVDWINSGFEGKPAFVRNFKGFLLDYADQYALEFIWDNNLVDLCDVFKFDVQAGLEARYADDGREYYAKCRVSGAVKNVEEFITGNFFGSGGWGGWYDIALTPELTPDGAYFEAESALEAGIYSGRGQELYKIELGQGFLSFEECEKEEEGEDGEIKYLSQEKCWTNTPGQVIEEHLEKTLGLKSDRLVIADEINEIVAALITQFASQVLGGEGGLYGGGSPAASRGYFQGTRDYVPYQDNPELGQEIQSQVETTEAAISTSGNGAGDGSGGDSYEDLVDEVEDIVADCAAQIGVQETQIITEDIAEDVGLFRSGQGGLALREQVFEEDYYPRLRIELADAGCDF